MPTRHVSARPTRVLAVLPAPRFTGFAVLDGMGIVSGGFASWNLRAARSDAERILVLRKRLAAALSRFHPTVVVVGIRNWKSVAATEMQAAVEQVALRHDFPVVRRPVVDSRKLLLGRPGGSAKNALAHQLVRGFFPRLAAWKKGANSSRYRCHAFSALALCLRELALRAPLSAAAISNAEALSVSGWSAFLAEQTRNLYPQENL
jgi:hypothetical protein